MTRHTLVDLALVLYAAPKRPPIDRLPAEKISAIRSLLAAEGLHVRETRESDERLHALREMYEPYVHSLSEPLPPWILEKAQTDNWQISACAWQAESIFKGRCAFRTYPQPGEPGAALL